MFRKFEEKINKSIYPVIRFNRVISYIQYGSSSLASVEKVGYPMIRMINLQNDDWDFSDLKYIQLNERDFKSWRLNKNDLLFNRTNSKELVGKCNVFKKDGNWVFASYLIRVVLDEKQMLPEYASFFLNSFIGRLQIDAVSRQIAGMTNINAEEIKALAIPLPPKETQLAIKILFQNALFQKKQKEQQAKDLLNSIDDYLLQELGIQLPTPPPNTIANRMFTSSWQKVAGNRFDPKRYTNQNEKLVASISATKEKKVLFKNIIVQSAAGDWGLDEKEISNQSLYQKCLVIRATEFDNRFNLKVESNRVKHRYILKQKLNKLDIRANDFLLEKSGGSPDQPVGRIAILENHLLQNESVCYSNFIHKFRVDYNVILPEYLFCFLKTIHNIGLTDVMQSQTNGIRNLIMSEYWNQVIPLPTKERQRKIADTIYEMRRAAKQIDIEAQHQFYQTKKEIEQMILE